MKYLKKNTVKLCNSCIANNISKINKEKFIKNLKRIKIVIKKRNAYRIENAKSKASFIKPVYKLMKIETWVQSQVESYQRLKKWYLMPPCLTLSIIRYGSRVKWSNPGKGVAPSPTPWCSKLSKREPSGHPRLWSPTFINNNKMNNINNNRII